MNVRNAGRTVFALAAVTAACLSTMPAAHTAAAVQDKQTIELGDLDPKVDAKSVGAPFDPCALGWGAFPAEVRPATDKKPKLRPPGKDDVFAVGCRYDNGGQDVVTNQPGGTPELGKNFITLVVWAKPGQMPTGQADHKGSQPATFGPKQGVIKAGTNNASKEPSCTAIFPLATGAVGVSITNGRFPMDTCAIATTVATSIAEKTP
jgi:hypothetical protein